MASTARQAQLDTSSVVDVTINQSSPTEMSKKMRRHHDDEIAGEPQKYYFEYIYGAHGVQKIIFPKSNLWF